MKPSVPLFLRRLTAQRLPDAPEIEKFGMEGEEAIARMLFREFDCVIRNVVVPHKDLYLEKDFLVVSSGVPFVLEIKNWKGEIVCEDGIFYQLKDNGVRKKCKDPVGTTRQFISRMRQYYGIEGEVRGAVVFAEPDCRLSLPQERDGIALLHARELVSYIRSAASAQAGTCEGLKPDRLLRCTRFYSEGREFCKGMLADVYLACYTAEDVRIRLDTTRLCYLSVEHQPLTLRDKLYVTYDNGRTDVFYNRDTEVHVALLDGSFCKLALNRIRHIVF